MEPTHLSPLPQTPSCPHPTPFPRSSCIPAYRSFEPPLPLVSGTSSLATTEPVNTWVKSHLTQQMPQRPFTLVLCRASTKL